MRLAVPILVALLFAAGCASDEIVATSQHGVESSNRIALNRIALNRIALNRIALNRIALNRIALNRIALNSITTTALADKDPELLGYVVSCAFPEGDTFVTTNSNGEELEFEGGIGLAPKWATRRLTLKEQRWMSACLLARVNNSGTSLFISLRGSHAALTVSVEESREFPLEEGAFYGDVFAEDQRFYACRGRDLYNGSFNDETLLRACAQPTEAGDATLCGMTYAGECGAFNVEKACEAQTGDHYDRCHSYPSKNLKWHDEGIETRFEEAITVYVSEFE